MVRIPTLATIHGQCFQTIFIFINLMKLDKNNTTIISQITFCVAGGIFLIMVNYISAAILSTSTLLLSFIGNAQKVSLPHNIGHFVVIAHRGDHTNAPENTLAAYQNAITAGADFVEIDLRTTKDSELVIMHNENTEHMTGEDKLVKDISFNTLRSIKIREKSHIGWGLHTIPTLKEVLKLCKGKINIYLDFKEADVAKTFEEIRDAGMQNNIVVYINEPYQLAEWQTIAPAMPLMISLPKAVKTKKEMFELMDGLNIDILDGSYKEYNAATVLAAKEMDIPIWADIQSKDEGADDWNAALSLGLSGLQTDHPKELIDFLIQKGIR